jgi:hypothetical protein
MGMIFHPSTSGPTHVPYWMVLLRQVHVPRFVEIEASYERSLDQGVILT